MYEKKITYDFTIKVYIAFSVSCQKYALTTLVRVVSCMWA